jgi:uncharacterized cupredoxin-like copper-binding protein
MSGPSALDANGVTRCCCADVVENQWKGGVMKVELLAAVALGGALVFAGCGDDDDETGGTAGTGSQIEATASEFTFTPASWTVPAGQEVTISFDNEGQVEHEWVIIDKGEDIASEAEFTEDKVLFEVEAIDPGANSEETFTVDEPGTYQVICALPGHFNAGMKGALTVN